MRLLFFASVFLLAFVQTLHAQSECLPQNYAISIGSGVMLPVVEGNRNDFFNKNGNKAGYYLMAEGRYYLMPNLALGMQYDYLRAANHPDKMHVHFVRPDITLRYLWSEGNQGAFFSLGVGYLDYQERTYPENQRNGHLFQKGYCGLSFAIGWEFRITTKISGVLRADALTTDWFVNPNARLFNPNPDEYDDGTNHRFFKNNITFFNLGFAVQFGR